MEKNLKIIEVLLILALLIGAFAPTTKVFADDVYGEGNYELMAKIEKEDETDTNVTITEVKVNGNNCASNFDVFKTGDGDYSIVIKGTIAEGYMLELRSRENIENLPGPEIDGQNFTYYINLNSSKIPWEEEGENFRISLGFYLSSQKIQNNNGNGQQPGGENNPGPEHNNPEDEFVDIEVNFRFVGTTGEVLINGRRAGKETDNWEGIVEKAGYNDNTRTNQITITSSFGAHKFSKVTINEVDYNFDDENDIHTIDVPGAPIYTIYAEADEGIQQDRTIIWANTDANKNAEEYEPDMLLEHGSAQIIAVYDEDNNKIADEATVDENGFGFISVRPGCKVLFQFVPEYGYQLISVKANGMELEPQETTNQYTFIMPDTNVHFSAEFKKTEDIVKAESTKVSSGSIVLEKNLEGGSVQLSVKDIDLSSDKIKGFENAAGDYKIASYLDIDLYNVFYKGKEDKEDVWANKIDELEKEAIITLKLEDGLTADDVVLVHNIHDEDTYEIIPIESYNPETNTITFKTKSFSSYAIATKENNEGSTKTHADEEKTDNTKTEEKSEATSKSENKKTDKSNNPKTGDNIIVIISIFAIATIGAVVTFKFNKQIK